MKMARAFIASVPLALVLVAAVIVPVALTPGSFGFHGWTQRPQQLAVETPVVVQVAEQPAVTRTRAVAVPPAVVRRAPAAPKEAPAPRRGNRPGPPRAPAAATPDAAPSPELAQDPASSPPPATAPAVPLLPVAPPQVKVEAPTTPVQDHTGVFEARAAGKREARKGQVKEHRNPSLRHGHGRGEGHDRKKRANPR
jgi:hypothetical protein